MSKKDRSPITPYGNPPEMTPAEKKQYRLEMANLKREMVGLPKNFMAFLPMRGKYYRGYKVTGKSDVALHVPTIDINKVWYWNLKDGVIW